MENTAGRIPEHLMPRNSGTDELFRNSWMEKLTRTHISVPVTMHMIIVISVSWFAVGRVGWMAYVLLFTAGWLTWTFTEYWVHRYVYHVKTDKTWLLKIQHLGHGIHHQYPKDPTRLAMPPVPALILISLFYLIFWLIMRVYAMGFFPGFLFGYVLYITLHYAEHRYKTPAYGPLKRLWKFHVLHHYKYPESKAFGVSTLLWDRVFGTLPPEEISL